MVAHIVIRRHDASPQQRDAELNEPRAVGLGAVRNRTDNRAGALAHLLQHFRNAVLSGDGEILFAAILAGGIQNAESAGIGGRRHQDSLALPLRAPGLVNCYKTWLAHAPAIKAQDPIGWNLRKPFADSLESAGDAALNEAACLREAHAQDPVH